ncbi:4-hydroxy-3-methylbut-2-enyl diphosphate reductase [Pseudonocardia acaciae]|uniref:4-hydroxy-3-methylbut-2-enyl diphosphate reductase n=1 Tax=Pseudonocardia acaciae TaxID=551276 RepID=UPI000AC855A0
MSRGFRQKPVLYTPLRIEHAALKTAAESMRLVRTGMGPKRAARARVDESSALVAGLGGARHTGIQPGDLVVADEVRSEDGRRVEIPSAPLLAAALRRRGLTTHIGTFQTGSALVVSRQPDPTGPMVVDMETAALAPRPNENTPFAAVRAIVDTPDHPLHTLGTAHRGVTALRSLRQAVPALEQWAAALGPREVHLAAPRSFCAGVSRAIDTVDRALDRFGAPVYVRRQIVHNAHVVRELESKGAIFVEEADEVPEGAVLVLAAHGVAPSVHHQAETRELRTIDATCPLVSKVHAEVRRYAGRGETVFLIGHADHEEVQGTLGEAPSSVIVVEDVEAARRVHPADPDKVSYTMQTTLAVDEAEDIAAVLRERFPKLTAPRTDDICYATTNRQQAIRAVAAATDLVLVVGSPNSSNSVRLVEVAEREGTPAHLVDDVGEVDLRWLAGAGRIGITAGASAPPHLVEQLVHCLGGLGPVETTETRLVDEDVLFTLPREVS